MKNSNVEWIGEIPSDWEVLRVKDGFTQKKAKAHQEDPVVLTLARSGVKIRDMSNAEGQFASSYYDYNPVIIDDMLINPMDLISGDNCSLSKVEGVISPAYVNLRYKEGFHPAYYQYYFKYQYWCMAFFAHGKGVSFENRWTLNNETLMKFPILVPPLEVQKSIANCLDKKCDEINGLMSDIQSQIDILEEYKKSVIAEAVTKGLNPDVEMKDSGIEWVQTMPSNWTEMPNKFIMKKEKIICHKYSGEDILSLTMNGVIVRDLDAGGKMPASFDGYQMIRPNNLLMCLFDYDVTPRCIGLIKNHGLTSPAYSQFVMKNGNSERYYYYYYLMIDNTKELLHLAKNLRHSFTEEQLGMINTPVPPINEQIAISDYLDTKCAQIDAVIADKKAQLETLAEYKKSLIYEYVTGKKEVPNAKISF